MITVDELRLLLRLNGIDDSEYTDEDLQTLIDYYIKMFDSLICFNYRIQRYNDFYPVDGRFDSLLLNHYPVTRILTLTVDNNDHAKDIREINHKSGVVYFIRPLMGDVRISYCSGWTQRAIERYIIPVIVDLIIYGIKYGDGGFISSITEGDVSVSFDTNNGLLDVNQRIKDLNRRFCPKARML